MQATLDQGASHGQPAARDPRAGPVDLARQHQPGAARHRHARASDRRGRHQRRHLQPHHLREGHRPLGSLRRALSAAARDGLDAREIFFKLAYADIRDGADLLRPAYDAAGGQDGYISFELPPELALDAAGSVEAAKRFYAEIDRENVFIKVPGTAEGVEAFEELTAAGVSVNVTLLFAVERYEEIAEA